MFSLVYLTQFTSLNKHTIAFCIFLYAIFESLVGHLKGSEDVSFLNMGSCLFYRSLVGLTVLRNILSLVPHGIACSRKFLLTRIHAWHLILVKNLIEIYLVQLVELQIYQSLWGKLQKFCKGLKEELPFSQSAQGLTCCHD